MSSDPEFTGKPLAPPAVNADPYAEPTLLDPYPFHQALRETGTVTYLPQYDVYAVGRYDEVKLVMSDWQRFSSVAGIGLIDRRDPESDKLRKTSPNDRGGPTGAHQDARRHAEAAFAARDPWLARALRPGGHEDRRSRLCRQRAARCGARPCGGDGLHGHSGIPGPGRAAQAPAGHRGR